MLKQFSLTPSYKGFPAQRLREEGTFYMNGRLGSPAILDVPNRTLGDGARVCPQDQSQRVDNGVARD